MTDANTLAEEQATKEAKPKTRVVKPEKTVTNPVSAKEQIKYQNEINKRLEDERKQKMIDAMLERAGKSTPRAKKAAPKAKGMTTG